MRSQQLSHLLAQLEPLERRVLLADAILLKDFRPNETLRGFHDDINGFTALGRSVIFAADDGIHGTELWATDGTAGGTRMIKDLALGPASGFRDSGAPQSFVAFRRNLYFLSARDLWRTDGTTEGTVRVFTAGTGTQAAARLTLAGERLFFEITPADSGPAQLWVSDGSGRGTTQLATFPRVDGTPENRFSGIGRFVPLGSSLVFSAFAPADGRELWISDGTKSGTRLLRDLAPGTSSGKPFSSDPQLLAVVGSRAYYFARSEETRTQSMLWRTDGTTAGTELVVPNKVTASLLHPAAVIGERIVFAGNEATPPFNGVHGVEPWITDGTPAGTFLLKDLNEGLREFGDVGSSPQRFTLVGSTVFFVAWNSTLGYELWKTDGTQAGTVIVRDLTPGTDPRNTYESQGLTFYELAPNHLVSANGRLYFAANDRGFTWGVIPPAGDRELWQTDGTGVGTTRAIDLNPGPNWSSPRNLTFVNGSVYFTAEREGVARVGLWKLTPEPPSVGNISGIAFHDLNGNGGMDRGEPRLSGYRVFLDRNNNGQFDSREPATRTDAAGNYRFSDIPVGTYWVRQTRVAGWGFTTPEAHRVRVDGIKDVRKHFGNSPRAAIFGTVFRDNNTNRFRDAGESGLPGWRVFLDADADGLFDEDEKSVLTDSAGQWRLDDLVVGHHAVRVVQPRGWRLTTPVSGGFAVTASAGSVDGPYPFGQKRLV